MYVCTYIQDVRFFCSDITSYVYLFYLSMHNQKLCCDWSEYFIGGITDLVNLLPYARQH